MSTDIRPNTRIHLDTHRPMMMSEQEVYYFHKLKPGRKKPDFFSLGVGAAHGYMEKGKLYYDLVGKVTTAPYRWKSSLGMDIQTVIADFEKLGYQYEILN